MLQIVTEQGYSRTWELKHLFEELASGEVVRLLGAQEPAAVQPLFPRVLLPHALYTHNVGVYQALVPAEQQYSNQSIDQYTNQSINQSLNINVNIGMDSLNIT